MTSRILVADDSPTIQKIVALAFENEDMEVKGAASGQEAWDMLGEFEPDIIMADVELPGFSGFELSRKIKSSADHQKRWVLLLSSDFEEFDEESFEACAAEDHLSKPFKSEDIVSKVQQMLSGEGIPNKLDVVEPEETQSAKAPVDLSADDIEDNEEEEKTPVAIDLSADDMEDSEEEGVMGLSPDDLIDELLEDPETEATPEPSVVELGADDLATNEEPAPEPEAAEEEPLESEPEEQEAAEVEPEPEPEDENAYSYLLTDDRITDFDESMMPLEPRPAADPEPEVVETPMAEQNGADPVEALQEDGAEVSADHFLEEPRRDPEPAEDLEHAFQAVSGRKEAADTTNLPTPAENSSTDETPDLIRESQAFLAEQSGTSPTAASTRPASVSEFSEEHMTEAMVQHAARVLEAGLDRNLKKELSGISEQVNRVVRDVVQEMAPDIIREVIRQEIQEIRKGR